MLLHNSRRKPSVISRQFSLPTGLLSSFPLIMSLQAARDYIIYNHGYFSAKSGSLSSSMWNLYGTAISKASSVISVPLPILSFIALPFFGSTSTTINVAFFWLVWTTFVWRYEPLEVEIYGTLAIRLLFFLLPSVAFIAFDAFVPSLSTSMKAAGEEQLPTRLGRKKLFNVTAVATFNILIGIALQAVIEYTMTEYAHFRSGLRVSTFVPPPWSIAKDVLRALVIRGFAHYAIHRYILHASPRDSPVARWHMDWAHSIQHPFSLAAAYDHPVCHLLVHWVPTYLPALIFRYHVLTWHILVAITSLEQLFIYSGYAVLPSRILLAGMARRTDAHYATNGEGNFGHWGVLDWAFGTTCGGSDVVHDLQDEAQKANVKGKVSDAKKNAKGLVGDAKERFGGSEQAEDDQEFEDEAESPTKGGPKRRSKRRTRRPSAAS